MTRRRSRKGSDMVKKYTEMNKAEYDSALSERFGCGVQIVDMGGGDIRVMRFVGYEDGDPEYEMNEAYPKAVAESEADGGVKVAGIEGVVFS